MTDIIFKALNSREVAQAIRLAADETLTYIATEIVRDAQQAAPIAFGNLRRLIALCAPYNDKGIRAIAVGIASGTGSDKVVGYARAVETGRRPGKMPPPDELRPWVEMVMGAGRTWRGMKGGAAYVRKGSRKQSDSIAREKQIRSMSFLVARAIGKRGTKPHPYLLPAYDRFAGKIGMMFQRRCEARLQALKMRPVN